MAKQKTSLACSSLKFRGKLRPKFVRLDAETNHPLPSSKPCVFSRILQLPAPSFSSSALLRAENTAWISFQSAAMKTSSACSVAASIPILMRARMEAPMPISKETSMAERRTHHPRLKAMQVPTTAAHQLRFVRGRVLPPEAQDLARFHPTCGLARRTKYHLFHLKGLNGRAGST